MALFPSTELFPSPTLYPDGGNTGSGPLPFLSTGPVSSPSEIPLREEFNDPEGRLFNYDTYDVNQFLQLGNQKHVDIRSFNQTAISSPYRMGDLDTLPIPIMDLFTMAALELGVVLKAGEQWTLGTVGRQSDRNNWRGISLICPTGLTATQSVMFQPYGQITATIDTVDIKTGFDDTDSISLALPNFPLANIDTHQSFIDFTSNSQGNFDLGPTDSIAFSRSTPGGFTLLALNSSSTLTNGDSELRFPRSYLGLADLTAITGVRFRIQATAPCVFRCMAIRLLSADWRYSPLDVNTELQTLERPVSVSGELSPTSYFPSNNLPNFPADYPIVFFSDNPPGNADPRPIDSHVALSFNTGSITSANFNIIRLFFRERNEVPITQLSLDPSATETTTQAQLDALGHQPDYGINEFTSRTQQLLDAETQVDLDNETQSDIERVPDFTFTSWLEAKLHWSTVNAMLYLGDQAGNGYSFNPVLLPNQDYMMFVNLVGSEFSVQIYTLDSIGDIGTQIFDSGIIEDDFIYKRRKGRNGWYTHFEDGDARVYALRPRGFSFAEARFLPLTSLTPVVGASITAAFSPDRDLLEVVAPGPWGGTLSPDMVKSNSGHCIKITNLGQTAKQGLQTNPIYFEDWDNTIISFDLLFPSSASAAPITAFLYGEFRIFLLDLGVIDFDVFQHHKILLPVGTLQTGPYNIVFIQSNVGVNTVWWLDNLRVRQRSLLWEAKGTKDDAWMDNVSEYVPFGDAINYPQGAGVLFPPGKTPQVRASALKQNAVISKIQVQPKYAELGRLVWPENIPSNLPPVSSFIATSAGQTIRFNSNSSTDPDGIIIAAHWDFGDGSFDVGPFVSHTYGAAGTYVATLTTIDNDGARSTSSQTITI